MTRISNVDQALMLLRQQLQQMTKADRSRRGARASHSSAQQRKSAAERIEALTRSGDLTEDELARALIGALLTDEFGDDAANDHRFRKLADEVHRIIASDTKAKALLAEALRKTRSPS